MAEPDVLEAKKLQSNTSQVPQPDGNQAASAGYISATAPHKRCAAIFSGHPPSPLRPRDDVEFSSKDYARFQSLLTTSRPRDALTLLLWVFLHHFCRWHPLSRTGSHYGGALGKARVSSKVGAGCGHPAHLADFDTAMVKRVLSPARITACGTGWLSASPRGDGCLYPVLAIALLFSPPHDYGAWKAVFSDSGMRIASFLFLVSLFWHAWVGMRNILMDYVHGTAIRLTLQYWSILSLLFYTIWSAEILWALGTSWR